jgi:hypothetical protein
VADDITYTTTSPAGVPNSTKQVTDEHATRGHMPVVKLAIATDASATLIPADGTDGLLVNLGANNDVTLSPLTSGGLSLYRSIDLDETEEEIKGTAGQLYGWYIFNDSASPVYVKIYNATAASVTVGSTTPVLTIPLPAGAAANAFSTIGIAFATAITAAATTGVADADTGAPAANDVVANFFYK